MPNNNGKVVYAEATVKWFLIILGISFVVMIVHLLVSLLLLNPMLLLLVAAPFALIFIPPAIYTWIKNI